MISVKHLDKYFNKGRQNEIHVIDDMTVELPEKGMVAVFGKSGCGKTTLLRHLKSVLTPHGQHEGVVQFNGVPLADVSERDQSSKIGFVMQNPDSQVVTDKV